MKLNKLTNIQGAYPSSSSNERYMVVVSNNPLKITLFGVENSKLKILDTENINKSCDSKFNKPNLVINKDNEVFICFGEDTYADKITIRKYIIHKDLLVYIREIYIDTTLKMISSPRIAFFNDQVYIIYQEHNDDKKTPADKIINKIVLKSFSKNLSDKIFDKELYKGNKDWRDCDIIGNDNYLVCGVKASGESGNFWKFDKENNIKNFYIYNGNNKSTVSYGRSFLVDNHFYHCYIGYPSQNVYLNRVNLADLYDGEEEVIFKINVNHLFDPIPQVKLDEKLRPFISGINEHGKEQFIVYEDENFKKKSQNIDCYKIPNINNNIELFQNNLILFIQSNKASIDILIPNKATFKNATEDNNIENNDKIEDNKTGKIKKILEIIKKILMLLNRG